ncbi:transposase [Capsulimonas corticalis]|uniref:Transposase n=1 Tax=Capsulimonas corticalis TaxID=2219043 RepID=A0A402D345_9BACT|nr:IS200/IS605 family transposase [Capsulimonas corticalis]BDI28348.1 transposase [Capsulimonas corticalis]
MRATHTELFVHLVWATWDRLPFITADIRPNVYRLLKDECEKQGGEVLEVGGVADHVHVLVRIPATVTVAWMVKQMKAVSSYALNIASQNGNIFKWQGAYGAFTLRRQDIGYIRAYIQNQEAHHRERTLDPDLELV